MHAAGRECTALVEGEERPMRQWDYLHCPPGTHHILVGAGDGPCAILTPIWSASTCR